MDLSSDERIGSYVTAIRENASSSTSGARGFPVSFCNCWFKICFGLRRILVDPIRKFHVSAEKILHHVGMLLEGIWDDDEVGDDELVIRPQVALIEKNPAARFVNQPRRPGLGSPGRVELSLQKERELVRVRDRKDLNVAALFPRS